MDHPPIPNPNIQRLFTSIQATAGGTQLGETHLIGQFESFTGIPGVVALGPTNNELVPRFQPSRFPDDTEEVGINPAIGASRSRWGTNVRMRQKGDILGNTF